MQSILLTGGTSARQSEFIDQLCTSNEIAKLDQHRITPEIKSSSDDSFGIALVRSVRKRAFLRPAYGKLQTMILPEAEKLTLPAQNALLKMLEEPPEHTLFILVAQTKNALLDTIASRCRIIFVEGEDGSEASSQAENSLLNSSTLADAFLLAEKIYKEKPEEWAKAELQHQHEQLIKKIQDNYTFSDIRSLKKMLEKTQSLYTLLTTTNTAPRLVLESFFLSS